MNIINLIANGFKKLFSGNNTLFKHLILFLITGLLSLISLHFEFISNQIKNTKVMPDFTGIAAGILALIIIGIYLCGYNFKFMHNALCENIEEILPDFNGDPFKIFFNVLPLIIVWTVYVLIAILISVMLFINPLLIPAGVTAIIAIAFFCTFIQFIYVEYARNFNSTGLFNITLPFKYIKSTIGPLVLLGLLFIPIYILSMFPSFLTGLILGLTGIKDKFILMYSGAVIGGYCGFIVQLVWYYCIVQIYKEKIEKTPL